MRTPTTLYRIAGKKFACGLIFTGTLCTGAAPMFKWVKGRQLDWVRQYCERKGYTMEVVE